MKYALFHWYAGEGNKYSFLGSLTKEEYDNYIKVVNFQSFLFIKCHTSSGDRDLEDRVYFDIQGNSYTYHHGHWETGHA